MTGHIRRLPRPAERAGTTGRAHRLMTFAAITALSLALWAAIIACVIAF